MSGSPTFALEVVACVLLGFVLWAACAGVGSAVLPRTVSAPDGPTSLQPASWRQPGVAACVGLGVLLFLGGVGVVLYLPWWATAGPFTLVGLVLAGREVRRASASRLTGHLRTIAVATAVALVAVALVEAVVGFRFPLHGWDDLRAYLPLAHRLIETGGLEDAWSARRLQSVGGFTYLQAMPVAIFGDRGLGVIETMLATIFLGGLLVANGLRTSWARLVGLGFVLAIPFFWSPRINTTGVLMGVPILVALLAVVVAARADLRAGGRAAAMRWGVAGGVLVAALMSVRPNLGILAAALIAGGVLVIRAGRLSTRITVLALAGVSTLVALLPWFVAANRSVGTPFYLLNPGNQVAEPARLAPADGLGDLLDHSWHLLRAGPYSWVVLAAVVIVVVARRRFPDPGFAAIAVVITGVVMASVALRGYTMAQIAFVRYTSPMSQALLVFLFLELLRATDARTAEARAGEGDHDARVPAGSVAGLVVAGLAVAVAFSGIGLSLEYRTMRGGARLAVDALRNRVPPQASAWVVSTPALRAQYRRAVRNVDPDRTISAVDRPYLIDYGRADLPNMDLPGFTAPGSEFPFLTGPRAKLERLRRAGYDTLLVTNPNRDIALRPTFLGAIAASDLPSYSPTTKYYLDWANDVLAVAEDAPRAVRRFGGLFVIDIDRAIDELREQPRPSSAP